MQDLGKLSMMTFDLQFASLCFYLKTLFDGVNHILQEIRKSNDLREGGAFFDRITRQQNLAKSTKLGTYKGNSTLI